MAKKRNLVTEEALFDDGEFDFTQLPDYNNDFVSEEDFAAFAKALSAPESPSTDDLTKPPQQPEFITALNDWRPVHQRVRRPKGRKRRRKAPARGVDETREGYVYTLLKWPLLSVVLGWIVVLGATYMFTRLYIYSYEHYITMRGKRERLRKNIRSKNTYDQWVSAAKEMDRYLGNEEWKEQDDYAFYNSNTVRSVRDELRRLRLAVEEHAGSPRNGEDFKGELDEMRALVEAAVKNNFVGIENTRLYAETYYGTKNLVQSFLDELELCLKMLASSESLTRDDKATMYRHLDTNYGRTALCLSGGATFAYYHFGVARALIDAGALPEVITGTSGGALVAALLATRTDAELKKLLVPALAHRITACQDDIQTWMRRWWNTGARFDSVDWARKCSWFCRGSLTFREAYELTGRILNVTCIPSDPHSPTVLANYLTAPDCVIWSAALASAAVPGILNPITLMRKTRSGTLAPYSFGHRWKDGSLRTDIPLRALNTQFNVTFSIVSQVNPHINLFFFSSRGTVGRPVTHRRGRGWRGGFLGSATEQYLKLDLTKWLQVLRHLELLPRPMGQDWSQIYLQRFSGTVTIWPKSKLSDFVYILSDPTPERLAGMIHAGQQSAFPKLKFIENRMKIEKLVEEGVRKYAGHSAPQTSTSGEVTGNNYENTHNGAPVAVPSVLSEEDLHGLLNQAKKSNGRVATKPAPAPIDTSHTARLRRPPAMAAPASAPARASSSPSALAKGLSWTTFFGSSSPSSSNTNTSPHVNGGSVATPNPSSNAATPKAPVHEKRRGSVLDELKRQSGVFWDDVADTTEGEGEGEADGGESEVEGSVYASAEGSVVDEGEERGDGSGGRD
ncbi:MAG: hypothetical protein M1831_005044 [Alyxoria varia]|nr:MAG: hypothetical protein M1831_005044 [Alyxoria varia]